MGHHLGDRYEAASQDQVAAYSRAVAKHCDHKFRHLSSDTAFARGLGDSRWELPSMVRWDAFIAGRHTKELILRPQARSYWRYRPFPPSVLNSLDEWQFSRMMLSIHRELLAGVVLCIDPREFSESELAGLDMSVIRRKILLVSPEQYEPSFDRVLLRLNAECPIAVNDAYDELHSRMTRDGVLKLYYKYPNTFASMSHFVPDGLREFVAFIQNGRCPCRHCHGRHLPVGFHIDHIVPRAAGGTGVLINLQATCGAYNSGRKRDRQEVHTVCYQSVIFDQAWRPVVPDFLLRLLLNQSCSTSDVSNMQEICRKLGASALLDHSHYPSHLRSAQSAITAHPRPI